MNGDDVVLRRAGSADALGAADVWLRSFEAALPSVRRAHDDDEVRAWFSHVVVPRYETWVAVTGSGVVGVMVLDGEDLAQLHLDPSWRGPGWAIASWPWPSDGDHTAWRCGRSRSTARPSGSTNGTASPRSNERTGATTKSENPTSATSGAPERHLASHHPAEAVEETGTTKGDAQREGPNPDLAATCPSREEFLPCINETFL